jgi:hypothetical protein
MVLFVKAGWLTGYLIALKTGFEVGLSPCAKVPLTESGFIYSQIISLLLLISKKCPFVPSQIRVELLH